MLKSDNMVNVDKCKTINEFEFEFENIFPAQFTLYNQKKCDSI